MSTEISTLGVVGSDGVVPVYEPNGRWCMWGLHEIYTGGPGQSRYVPKLKDYVIDRDTFTVYIVREIDPVTLIPTLDIMRMSNSDGTFGESDILFGVGPGTQADTYRIYIDTSVMPHTLAVDARLKIGGSMAQYAQIFKGADVSNPGNVISRIYDASGNFVTNNVPLELVSVDSHVNYAIKNVGVCYTNINLQDGDLVTVVIFSADGHVVSKRQLLVENTAFIRQASAGQRYITSIGLSCPFMSPTDPSTVEFPLNVPINALNIMGVVNYSDGSSMTLPVDGSKFKVLGLEQYVSTIIGQKFELVLSYTLSQGEAVYGAVSSDNKFITAPYWIVTTNPNNSYAVKIFGYPVWLNESNGYTMRWFLFNLDRNIFFDVTPNVNFAENTGAFNPKGYGVLQRKAIQLNLRDVSGAFKPYVHTQLVDIILNGKPNDYETPWTMINTSGTGVVPYGAQLEATLLPNETQKIRIDSEITVFEEWKERVYNNTYPLIDNTRELNPPDPTHFTISYGNREVTFPISQWNTVLDMGVDLPNYSTIFIRFFKRTVSTDMQLSMAAMIVRR